MRDTHGINKWVPALIFLVALTGFFWWSASALAAPPVKRITYGKAVAEWTRQAQAQGVPIACDEWRPGMSPTCRFGEYDAVRLFVTADPCALTASVSRRQQPGTPTLHVGQRSWRVTVPVCKPPRVWLATLPVPWKPPTR